MRNRRAFTFAELMISAAIFATVLLMAFTTIAAVNRLQRQTRAQRAFAGTAQKTWQTITQLARYAQKPAAPLTCGINSPPLSVVPPATLQEAVTVQDTDPFGNGRRLWLVAPDLSGAGQYRVFLFAAVAPDAESRYQLYSASFKATGGGVCAADLPASDLMAGADLRLRILPTDPYPFALPALPPAQVTGVPKPEGLLADEAWSKPWLLTIRLNVVNADGSGVMLPVYSQVVSRTPQQVITSP